MVNLKWWSLNLRRNLFFDGLILGVEGLQGSNYGGGIPPVMEEDQFFNLITL